MKSAVEMKGLRVNMGKIKIMVTGINLDLLSKSGKDPGLSVATQSSVVSQIHKKCSGIKGTLRPDSAKSLEKARPINGRTIHIPKLPIKVIKSF